MDKLEKVGFTALLSALFAWLGVVAVPFLLLVLLQFKFIDYGTGLAAAKYRSEKISSYKSFRGIVKKVCMWLLVVVGGATPATMLTATTGSAGSGGIWTGSGLRSAGRNR